LLIAPAVYLHRKRPRTVAAALAAGVVVPGAIVVMVLVVTRDASSVADVVSIFITPVASPHYLSLPSPTGVAVAWYGLALWRYDNVVPVFPSSVGALFDGLGWLVVVLLAVLLCAGVAAVMRQRPPLGVVAVAGIAALLPLWLVWDTGNTEHVVAAAPLFATVLACGSVAVGVRRSLPILVAAAVAMLVVNGVGSALIGTQKHLSRTLVVAEHVREHLAQHATLISVGIDHEYRLTLPYLSGRRVVSLTSTVHAGSRAGASPHDALRRWLEAASSAPDPWLLEDLDDPSVAAWVEELGITAGEWRWARSHFRVRSVTELPADGVVIRRPLRLQRFEFVASAAGEGARD
jgi:hypothetical protein